MDQDRSLTPPAEAGYDVDGDPLTLTFPAPPTHGTASQPTGKLQVAYAAAAGYLGPDTLTFTLEDDSHATSSYQLDLQVSRILTCQVDADCGGGDLCIQSACMPADTLDARAGSWGCSTGAGSAAALWAVLALGLVRRRPRRQAR